MWKDEVLDTIKQALAQNLKGLEYEVTFDAIECEVSSDEISFTPYTAEQSWEILFQVLGVERTPKDKVFPPYLRAKVNTLESSTGFVFNCTEALELRDLRLLMKIENPFERDEQCLDYLYDFMLALGFNLKNCIDAQNAA